MKTVAMLVIVVRVMVVVGLFSSQYAENICHTSKTSSGAFSYF